MSEPFSPVGALETLIIAKENNFGTKPSMGSGIGQAFNTFPSSIKTNTQGRSPRGSLTQPVPAPGGRTLASSLDVETTADTIGQILAYGLGSQVVHATSTLYAGTVAAAVAIGDVALKVSKNSVVGPALLFPGMKLDVDTASNKETFIIGTVNWSGAGVPGAGWIAMTGSVVGSSTGFTKVHAPATVVVGTATCGLNTMTPGSPLPTFTAQIARPGGIAANRLGCKIDQLSLSFKSKQGLTVKASVCIRDEQKESSPTAATLSALNPYVFEQLFVPPTFGGQALSNGSNSSLRSLDVTVNNNLLKDNFVGGGGNLVYSWPEQLRTISGSMMLGFETEDEFDAFQSNSAGGPFQYTSLVMPFQGIDSLTGLAIPYFIVLYFPKVAITDWGAPDDTGKEITQTLSLSFGESAPGAGDAIQAFLNQVGNSQF